ncbi:phosphoribosylformylglycinamidine synthase subunit PurQ [candidate division KSB1 bacterium]|nr:phosphoribosylformylglycinamidine synthase subunit PurQ [candidate division KSB1 bacterium]
MMKKLGVVVFPGSNCDHDLYHVLDQEKPGNVRFVWHKETDISDLGAVFLPGGFSYGDYLRSGAIARFSPVMKEVIAFANAGYPVLGICNGFQVLCEASLLPGALLRNAGIDFACQQVYLSVQSSKSMYTANCQSGHVLKMPIAHGDGNYFAPDEVIKSLYEHDQILFKYCTSAGEILMDANPNGSVDNIAGIRNKQGNVMGMMPHPERAAEPVLGTDDGRMIFTSLLNEM